MVLKKIQKNYPYCSLQVYCIIDYLCNFYVFLYTAEHPHQQVAVMHLYTNRRRRKRGSDRRRRRRSCQPGLTNEWGLGGNQEETLPASYLFPSSRLQDCKQHGVGAVKVSANSPAARKTSPTTSSLSSGRSAVTFPSAVCVV